MHSVSKWPRACDESIRGPIKAHEEIGGMLASLHYEKSRLQSRPDEGIKPARLDREVRDAGTPTQSLNSFR